MNPASKLPTTLLLLLSLFLSACGFHLRGEYQIPDSLMILHLSSSDEFSALTKAIHAQLSHNHIQLVEADAGIPNLHIGKEHLATRTLSLYETGQVAEYEMSYSVKIKVTRKNHDDEHFQIKFHRDYLDNPLAALAKSKERELIMAEFRNMASEQVLRYLATIKH